MSTLAQQVNALVAGIREGKILDTFDRYYADEVVMQENNNPPVAGKPANRKREQQFVDSVKTWKGFNLRAVGIDEQRGIALIQSDFEFESVDGKHVRYDQVAVQQWRDGKVVHEKFYYDSAAAK